MTARVPQLDGLRAVAVLLVVAAHVGFLVDLSPGGRRALAPLISGDGVELFFVLSGYLITGILVREREQSGAMSLRRFYVRRTLRIWPALYVFLGVAAVLALLGLVDLRLTDVLLAGLFVWNYVLHAARFIGHTWSLAVEEQFYLVWPVVLQRLSARRALGVALALVVATPFLRLLTWDLMDGDRFRISFMTHARADALMIGAALALAPVACPQAYAALVRAVLRWRVDLLAAVGFFLVWPWTLVAFLPPHQSAQFATVWSRSPLGICGALVLLGLVERPAGLLARVLSTRVAVHVGVLSYSLYLWQEPFLLPSYSLALPLRLLAAVAAAELSLWLVERPFLRLKERYASTPRVVA